MTAVDSSDSPIPPPNQPGNGATGPDGPTPPGGPEEPGANRRSTLLIALIVLVVLLVGIVIGLLLRGDDEGADDSERIAAVDLDDASREDGEEATTESEGDAPSTTAGAPSTSAATPTTAGSPPPAPAPPQGTPSPSVDSVSAPSVYACSEAPAYESGNQLTLSWTTTGAASVAIAIDSPNGVFVDGLPANGSVAVPAPCAPDSNTYYVIATDAQGRTNTRSVTTQGV